MPFFANTPESLVARSDSKNPATTCRGITSNGRPCRRPLATADSTPPPPRTKMGKLRADDPRDEPLYCWQHKEQASMSARSSPGPRASVTPILEERTSLDTLADRLGLETRRSTLKPGKTSRPQQSGTTAAGGGGGSGRPSKMARPKPKSHLSCFCFKIPIEEVTPPPRPKPHVLQPLNAAAHRPPGQQHHLAPTSSVPSRPGLSGQSQNSGRNSRHSSTNSASSQTAQYLSLIPASATPQTASALMSELAKPISLLDEPGYIYMFWLTPEAQQSAPPADAARSLLTPPPVAPPRPGTGQRRPSDVIASFAAAETTSRSPGARRQPAKILLKIGRANNVQRRLNEWKRQCGYNLSLIRYYPYIPSSSPGPVSVPRKMPHSHKVERLIHIELAGAGLRVADGGKCDACGREHREWFEVEASRRGVMAVDEIVRRWADWDEGRG